MPCYEIVQLRLEPYRIFLLFYHEIKFHSLSTPNQRRQIIRQRMENRRMDLFAVARTAIYDSENSPYPKLLRLIGCEYGDFEHIIYSEEDAFHVWNCGYLLFGWQ